MGWALSAGGASQGVCVPHSLCRAPWANTHPKYTSCHPKVRWGASQNGPFLPPFLVHPSAVQSHWNSAVIHSHSAEMLRAPGTHVGLAGCTQPNRVLKAHQLTEHGHPCTAAPVFQLPTDTRTVHGRQSNSQYQENWENTRSPRQPRWRSLPIFPVAQSMFCCLEAQTSSGRVSLFLMPKDFW